MKFNRVDDTRVECIISPEDLEEFGIGLEDLLTHKKEAMEFLKGIVERAEEEVDFKPMGGAIMPMQVSVSDDHSVSITLSEDPDGTMQDMLRNLTEKAGIRFPKEFLEEIGDAPEEERIQRINDYLRQIHGEDANHTEKSKSIFSSKKDKSLSSARKEKLRGGEDAQNKQKRFALERLEETGFVFEFKDMSSIISFSQLFAGKPVKMQSTLYRDGKSGYYYMHFLKNKDSVHHFASVFTMAYEFGSFATSNLVNMSYMEESMDLIIRDKAVNTLRKFQ